MPLAVVIHPIFIATAITVNFTFLALLDYVADDCARDSANHRALDSVITGSSTDSRTAYPADKRAAANAVRCTSAQQRGEGQAQYCDFHSFSFLVRR